MGVGRVQYIFACAFVSHILFFCSTAEVSKEIFCVKVKKKSSHLNMPSDVVQGSE